MKDIYEIRFWGSHDGSVMENIKVGGKYSHAFDTWQDAWDAANALLKSACRKGAEQMDINNKFYSIVDD